MERLDPLCNRSACAILLASLFMLSVATADIDTSQARPTVTYPVVVPGSHLAELLGEAISGIRLFACHHGIMQAVPLQVDQRDSQGNWVWSDIVTPESRHSAEYDIFLQPPSGLRDGRTQDDQDPDTQAVLDGNDVLVFMAQDMGEHAADAAVFPAHPDTVSEIEITDPVSGMRHWAYAAYYASNPPPLSPVRYLRYEKNADRVISPVYEMTFSQQHSGMLAQLSVNGHDLLDRTKIRGTLRIGGSRFGRDFNFSEDNIDGYVHAFINGPVRVVRRTVASIRFGLLSSTDIACDQFFYPYHSEIPVRLPVTRLLHSVSLRLAADYHNSPFVRAYTDIRHAPIQLGISSVHNLLEDSDNVQWIALTGEGVSVISMLTLPKDIQAFARVTPQLFYDRKLVDPPETFAGSEPEAGYLIETRPALPRGDYLLVGTYVYLPHAFREIDAGQLAAQKPDYRVTSRSRQPVFSQTAADPRPAAVIGRHNPQPD